jgi:hypothetical protein
MSLFSTLRSTSLLAFHCVVRPVKGFRTGAVVLDGIGTKNPIIPRHETKRLLSNDLPNASSSMVPTKPSQEVLSIWGGVVTVIISVYGLNLSLQGQTKSDMNDLKGELKTEMKELKGEMKSEMKELKGDITLLKYGGIVLSSIAMVAIVGLQVALGQKAMK